MIQTISELLNFYAQKFHLNILYATQMWQLVEWATEGIVVGVPPEVGKPFASGDMTFLLDGTFTQPGGNVILLDDTAVGVYAESCLLFYVHPTNPSALRYIKETIDHYLPKIVRAFRKAERTAFLGILLSSAAQRKIELKEIIESAEYRLDELSNEAGSLSRRIAMDKRILSLLGKPDHFRKMMLRQFSDLNRMVPGLYSKIEFEGRKITAYTQPITIAYEGIDYDFDPYEVSFDLWDSTIEIHGGKKVHEYIHPHVTAGGNICWGNIHGLVLKLAGEMNLPGLFQLIHQYLITYNPNDPYQRIEYWDSEWTPDNEDDCWCEWCDSSSHDTSECDYCWYCDICGEYVDHSPEDCPSRNDDEEPETEEVENAAVNAEVSVPA